jgi:hypothetical protein
MPNKGKNWKTWLYLPVSLGALAFAIFGISNILTAQSGNTSDQGAAGDGSLNLTGVEQNLSPSGGNCDPGNCAACGFCAGARITDSSETSPVELTIKADLY